jgi:hypothetical protein
MGMKKIFVLLPVALAGLVAYGVHSDVICFVALAKIAGHILHVAASVLTS